jgi:hypothetical protein
MENITVGGHTLAQINVNLPVQAMAGKRRVIEFFLEPIGEHFDEGLKVR